MGSVDGGSFGGGGGAPTGSAGGDLTGTYPNPTIGANKVVLADLATQASGTVLANVTGSTAVPTAVAYANLYMMGFGDPLRPTGALIETYPRWATPTTNQGGAATGTMRLFAVSLEAGMVINSASFLSMTTPLSAGTAQWFALYDSSRSKLSVTYDDEGTAWSANSIKTLAYCSRFTDGVVSGTSLTSASAAFVNAAYPAGDVGAQVSIHNAGTAGTIPFGISSATVTISSVTNGTTVVLSGAAPTAIGSGATFFVQRPYTVPTSALYHVAINVTAGTTPSFGGHGGTTNPPLNLTPALGSTSTTGLTDASTAPGTAASLSVGSIRYYAYLS